MASGGALCIVVAVSLLGSTWASTASVDPNAVCTSSNTVGGVCNCEDYGIRDADDCTAKAGKSTTSFTDNMCTIGNFICYVTNNNQPSTWSCSPYAQWQCGTPAITDADDCTGFCTRGPYTHGTYSDGNCECHFPQKGASNQCPSAAMCTPSSSSEAITTLTTTAVTPADTTAGLQTINPSGPCTSTTSVQCNCIDYGITDEASCTAKAGKDATFSDGTCTDTFWTCYIPASGKPSTWDCAPYANWTCPDHKYTAEECQNFCTTDNGPYAAGNSAGFNGCLCQNLGASESNQCPFTAECKSDTTTTTPAPVTTAAAGSETTAAGAATTTAAGAATTTAAGAAVTTPAENTCAPLCINSIQTCQSVCELNTFVDVTDNVIKCTCQKGAQMIACTGVVDASLASSCGGGGSSGGSGGKGGTSVSVSFGGGKLAGLIVGILLLLAGCVVATYYLKNNNNKKNPYKATSNEEYDMDHNYLVMSN